MRQSPTTPQDRSALAHALLIVVEQAIGDRARDRRTFYRTGSGRNWPDLKVLNDYLLRDLFLLRRKAKRVVQWERLESALGDHFAHPLDPRDPGRLMVGR